MNLLEYIYENMVRIPEGIELIRNFIDPNKWISSNYKMSIPGRKEKIIKEKMISIPSFYMLKIPVTHALMSYIMDIDYEI